MLPDLGTVVVRLAGRGQRAASARIAPAGCRGLEGGTDMDWARLEQWMREPHCSSGAEDRWAENRLPAFVFIDERRVFGLLAAATRTTPREMVARAYLAVAEATRADVATQ